MLVDLALQGRFPLSDFVSETIGLEDVDEAHDVVGGVVEEGVGLAVGVGLGVLTAMVLFARRVAHFATVTRTLNEEDDQAVARYTVDGELFWASSNDLYTQFEYAEDPQHVVIDLTTSHLWDASTIAALDSVEDKYRHYGKHVEVIGLNQASQAMRTRMSGRLGSGH